MHETTACADLIDLPHHVSEKTLVMEDGTIIPINDIAAIATKEGNS